MTKDTKASPVVLDDAQLDDSSAGLFTLDIGTVGNVRMAKPRNRIELVSLEEIEDL